MHAVAVTSRSEQIVPQGLSATVLEWDYVLWDSDGYFVAPDHIVIPEGLDGLYAVGCQFTWRAADEEGSPSTSIEMWCQVGLNGVQAAGDVKSAVMVRQTFEGPEALAVAHLDLVAGDVLNVSVLQYGFLPTDTLSVLANGAYQSSPSFWATRLGPRPKRPFIGDGGVEWDGTATFVVGLYWTAAGGIEWDGAADFSAGRSFEASGGFEYNGSADFATSSHPGTSGGFEWNGAADFSAGASLSGSGGFEWNGSADF